VLTIGELSRATQVTVKTIRYYQELGILMPVKVDIMSGYRYYDQNSFERVGAIISLKELGFTLKEIQEILKNCSTESDLQSFIKSKIKEIRSEMAKLKSIESQLRVFEKQITEKPIEFDTGIEEFYLSMPHCAALKVIGTYDKIGIGIRTLYKKAARYIKGAPYAFYYDMEYRETDAKMDAVIELKKKVITDGLEYRSIESRKAVKLIHKGPYGTQGSSYIRLFEYCRESGYSPVSPIIEHFIKGPGMIFRGNPENYRTECILLVEDNRTVESN